MVAADGSYHHLIPDVWRYLSYLLCVGFNPKDLISSYLSLRQTKSHVEFDAFFSLIKDIALPLCSSGVGSSVVVGHQPGERVMLI